MQDQTQQKLSSVRDESALVMPAPILKCLKSNEIVENHIISTGLRSDSEDARSTDSITSNLINKRPNTRSRKENKRQRTIDATEACSPAGEEDTALDDAIVQSAAAALASLDKRACARTVIRKANAVLEEILMPMSLPWAHKVEPLYRVVARDIDEMPGILNADDETSEHDHGSIKNNGRFRALQTIQAAVRRSSDPGVMELTMAYNPTQAQRHLAYSPKPHNLLEEDPSLPGEMSLRVYQEVQRRKKPRLLMESVNQRTTMVSLRLGCSSSRLTLFDRQHGSNMPLLIPAVFPKHVQDGSRKNMDPTILEQIHDLGSYNCRPIPSSWSVNPNGRNRLFVGRNRIIWSEKETENAKSQRPIFRSILNGQRLEQGTYKRPINLKIGIRLNGTLLSSGDPSAGKALAALESSLVSKESFSYPTRVVKSALDEACSLTEKTTVNNGQCTIDFDKFLFNVSRDLQLSNTGQNSRNLVSLIRHQLSVSKTIRAGNKKQNRENAASKRSLNIDPPWLDCVPTEDGLLRVVCSRKGCIAWGSIPPSSQSKASPQILSSATFLLSEMAREIKRCAICWSDTNLLVEGESQKCKWCQVPVHAACISEKPCMNWSCITCQLEHDKQCDVHSAHSSTDTPSCFVCGHAGGILEKGEPNGGYIHTICRIWCSDALSGTEGSVSTFDDTAVAPRCDLCNSGSSPVIRCAADGCSIRFHPMCAILHSAAFRINHSNLWNGDAKTRDALLCTQYQLSMMHTAYRDACKFYGDSIDLPIGFCGYHNRNRAEDFYGMYPGGCCIEGAVRIPPRIGKNRSS